MEFSIGVLPEAARILRNSPRHMKLFCVLLTVGLCLAALAWGVALLVALPRGVGALLLGPVWRPTYPLVLPTTLFMMGGCASAGAGTYLHALGNARRSLRAGVIQAMLYVVGSLAGAASGGAIGTMRGAAVGMWIGALVFWLQLRAALRESRTLSAGPLVQHHRGGRHRSGSTSFRRVTYPWRRR